MVSPEIPPLPCPRPPLPRFPPPCPSTLHHIHVFPGLSNGPLSGWPKVTTGQEVLERLLGEADLEGEGGGGWVGWEGLGGTRMGGLQPGLFAIAGGLRGAGWAAGCSRILQQQA